MRPFKISSRRAFTLIEVLLAIGILGGLMVAIYASWHAIVKSSQVGIDAAVEAHRMRVAVRAIEDAFQSGVVYELNLPFYAFYTDTSTPDFAAMSIVSRLPPSFPGSGLFFGQPVRRVTFTVVKTNGMNQLIMRQNPILDPLEDGALPYGMVLAKNVGLFSLEFWDAQLGDWAPEWAFTNQIPAMVKFSLGVMPPDQRQLRVEDVVTRILSIPSAPVQARLQRMGPRGAPNLAVPGRVQQQPVVQQRPVVQQQPVRRQNR